MNIPTLNALLHSFNARIIGATLLLLTMTTMALNCYFYSRASKELEQELIHHNQSMAKVLANSSRIGIFTADAKALTTAADFVTREPDCQFIVFFADNGTPLQRHGSCPQAAALLAPLSDRELFWKIRARQATPSFSFPVNDNLVVVEPVMATPKLSEEEIFFPSTGAAKPAAKTIGFVVLAVDTTNHRNKIDAMFIRDTTITTSATLLTCLIIFGVIHYLTRPLNQLTREIMAGTLAAYPPAGEAPDVPHDFQHMITIIRESFQTINELKTTLEAKVAARTRQLATKNDELITQKDGLAKANQRLAITISQLQTTQAQLVQSEKMAALGLLIAGLSHEIKNSINFISGSVPLLKKTLSTLRVEQPTPEAPNPVAQASTLLDNIQEGVNRTVRVIDDLAHFCHDSGAGFVPIDLLPGLKASVAMLRHEYSPRIAILEEYAERLPQIMARPGQLNQVFINILINAAQAIPEQGTILVKTWDEETTVHVSIADSGHGIKERDMNRIYNPFFTTKEVGQGTGLGLSISYNIIKNHGGNLKVNSTPGAGTTFEIVLPAIPA
jgi:signal transduction histidine kinase